jgi:Ca2+-binding EF-hand superfamily protein
VRHILNKLDKDNSGSINFNEFASAVASKEKLWAKESLSDAFDYFDTDKTGYI